MKKLSILAAALAVGTMCVAGCDMGGANSAKIPEPEPSNIVTLEENKDGEQTPVPCPDGNCDGKKDCDRDKMPYAKPNFRFHIPHIGHRGHGKDKFPLPHKKPTPSPEPEEPEAPVEEENQNN